VACRGEHPASINAIANPMLMMGFSLIILVASFSAKSKETSCYSHTTGGMLRYQ